MKTKVMHIYNSYLRKNEKIKVKIHINSCLHSFGLYCACPIIEQVHEYKYLGVIVDQNFNWGPHIESVVKKVRSIIPSLYQLKPIVNENTLRQVYFSLVHSFIIYGIVGWGFVDSSAMTKLKKCQKKVLKLMKKGDKFDSDCDLFRYWKVLPVNFQAKHAVVCENYFNDMHGELRVHDHETRLMNNDQLITPRSVNRFGDRMIEFLFPRIWNDLPQELKNLASDEIVKVKVKEWLLSCV
jgi:hypothetical protein